MELTEILKLGESETVEFKKSIGEWKEIVETLSALANTRGGILLIGNWRTSTANINDLVNKKVFQKIGTTGRGTYYVLNPAIKTQKTQERRNKDAIEQKKGNNWAKNDNKESGNA